MSNKTIWKGGPSLLLLLPLVLNLMIWVSLSLLLYFMAKDNIFDNFMNSNFFLEFILGLVKSYGIYVLYALSGYVLYLQLKIISFATKISCESYSLDKNCLSITTGVSKVQGQEIKILNINSFNVEQPFYLKIFGFGHISIYSSEVNSDELIEEEDQKLIVMAGMKNPEKIEKNLRLIIKKLKNNRLQ